MNENFILNLLEKFSASQAAELDLNDGTTRLVLRKEGAFAGMAAGGSSCMAIGSGGLSKGQSACNSNTADNDSAGSAGRMVRLGLPATPAGGATTPTVPAGAINPVGASAAIPADASAATGSAIPAGSSAATSAAAPVTVGTELITSPIVASYYASPSPDAPPFVRPGTKVKTGDTLCILEAMKMMNHLEAEFDCEIIAVKAAGGDLVEYGQTLFEVKRL